jgi:hypothetical protein
VPAFSRRTPLESGQRIPQSESDKQRQRLKYNKIQR